MWGDTDTKIQPEVNWGQEDVPEAEAGDIDIAEPRKKLTAIQKIGQYYKEAVAAPVRTLESMIGGLTGGLLRMGAEEATIGRIMTDVGGLTVDIPGAKLLRAAAQTNTVRRIMTDKLGKAYNIPGAPVIAEHLVRKYGPDRALTFYDRKMQKHADTGKKIQDFWDEQANKGWEAPDPTIVEARWRDRPLTKGISTIYSGLTSIGVVVGATYLTKSPHPGLAILAASETGNMYSRLREKDVPPNIASKLSQMAGAWTYATEKVGFEKLLKPGAKTIVKALEKSGWEGFQEVAETMGHNLLEYFGYDYRKPEDIPTAVKAAVDHIWDDTFDALVGGIGAGGMVHVMLPGARPGLSDRQIKKLDKQLEPIFAEAERRKLPKAKPIPTTLYHGTSDISAIQKEGIIADPARTGSLSLTDSPEFAGRFGDVAKVVIPPHVRNKILDLTVDKNEFDAVKNLFPYGEFYNRYTKDQHVRKEQLVGLDALTVEQKKWLIDNEYAGVKYLSTMMGGPRGVEFRLVRDNIPPGWIKKFRGPVMRPPTVTELTKKPIEEIAPQTSDHAIGHQYGLTNKEVDSKLDQAELRYRELKLKETGERTPAETEELAFLSRNRTDTEAILERETRPPVPPKIKRTQKNLLALGHKIAREAKLTDEEYRDFAEIVTGKRSMGDMSKAERNKFVLALEESYGAPKELLPEDYDKPIQVMGRTTTMRKIYSAALEATAKLKNKREIPKIVKIGFGKFRPIHAVTNFFFGIDNTPVFHLARILDGAKKDGIFSEVLDKNIEQNRDTAYTHARDVTDALRKDLEDAGITNDDLAKMGKSTNPRLRTHQMISKGAATETFIETINGQDFQMTWANLMHIYLIANQVKGMRHVKGGGLIIHGVRTGGISDERINGLMQKVEENPKAKKIIDIILEIGEVIWKPSINQVSWQTEGKAIATEPNWFGFRVYMPKKIAGKVRMEKLSRADINLLEDRGIFHDRTMSTAPLFVGDVFNEFNVFENAIAEYVGMAEASRTSRTLLNDPSIATVLDQKGYNEVRERILKIHERAQSTPVPEGSFSAWFEKLLPGLYRAVVHYNPRLVVSQYTSVWNYGAYVSPEFLFNKAMMMDGLDPKAMRETLELSNVAWNRFYMSHSSLELGESVKADATLRMWTGGKSSDINFAAWAAKIADLGALTKGMKTAQKEYQAARNNTIKGFSAEWWVDKENLPEADIELWRKVKEREKTAEEKEFSEKEKIERQAVQRWQQLISGRAEYLWQRSQPSWDKWNRSKVTSEKGMRRLYLLFRSFHEKSLTIFNEAKLDYEYSDKTLDDKAKFAQKGGSVLAGYTFNTMLRIAIMAAITRELKEPVKYFEEFITSWTAMFPIYGRILKSAINRFVDTIAGAKLTYTGEPLESYPIRIVNMALKSPVDFSEATAHVLMGDIDKAEDVFKRGADRLAEGILTIQGVPVTEIKRFIPEGEEEPTGGRGATRRPSGRRSGR